MPVPPAWRRRLPPEVTVVAPVVVEPMVRGCMLVVWMVAAALRTRLPETDAAPAVMREFPDAAGSMKYGLFAWS